MARRPLACPPHPHLYAVTNLNAHEYPEEDCWRHIILPSLACDDALSCSLAAKKVKMPLATELAVRLQRFDLVLYMDDKIEFGSTEAIQQLVAQAALRRDWSLLLRRHEGDLHGHRGVEAELRAALLQPRYRARESQIRRFIDEEQAHVPRDGQLHSTSLLLWNMRSKTAKAISRFWLDSTLRTSPECQLTFYYAHQRWSESIVTVPHEQPGVRWRMSDDWGEYQALTQTHTRTHTAPKKKKRRRASRPRGT